MVAKKFYLLRTFLVFLIAFCFVSNGKADLTVYFLDVCQGDSAIIVCDDEAMIIDGGLPGQSSKIHSFLEDLHIKELVYVVATHPDQDHIGGLPAALQQVKVRYVFSPVEKYGSDRFDDLLRYTKNQRKRIKVPYDKEEHYLGKTGEAKITFYNCGKKNFVQSLRDKVSSIINRNEPEENHENNDISLVVRIDYGNVAFLFTGDIEKDAEQRLLEDSGVDLKADVIKISHHGSDSSSTRDFLQKVNPTYAVISCGESNKFGHPSATTLKSLLEMDIKLFRTDMQGDITFSSDGETITFNTEKQAQGDLYQVQR